MKTLHLVTWILLVIGGLNWGIQVFGWGIGNLLPMSVSKIVYLLVGVAAVIEIFTHKNSCKHCESKAPVSSM